MNEVQVSEIQQIEVEINFYKGQAVQSIFEIGKRLIRAKDLKEHGEWKLWLENNVEMSQWTANRFMKVSREFSNYGTVNNLTQSKVFALLALPKEEIETFIEENPVEDMTTRELRQAIRDKKELEKKIEEFTSQHSRLEEENTTLKNIKPEIIKQIIKEEVIPEHIKDKLIDLEEDKKELEKLRQAGLELKEYDSQRLEIDRKIKERTKEYESLMTTMRRLEGSYDEKNKRLTVQANLLNKIKTAVKPLKEFNTEIDRLFNVTGELDAISAKEVMSEINAAYKVLSLIEENMKTTNVEVIYYEKQ